MSFFVCFFLASVKKDRCGTARHFNNKCSDNNNPHEFLQVQLIESVISDYDLEGKLWEREKYWQCQLFTNTHGMNSVSDLYSSKGKGCREKVDPLSRSLFNLLCQLLFA